MKHFVYYFLLFLYLFPVKFTFFPISTRIIVSFVGILFLFFDINRSWKIPKFYFIVIGALIPLLFSGVISVFINTSDDLYFVVDLPLTIIISALGSYGIVKCFFLTYTQPRLEYFLDSIFSCVLVQFIITFMIYLSPSISKYLASIQYLKENQLYLLLIDNRLSGFGFSSFYAAYLCSFCLISIPLIFAISKHKLNVSKYVFIYSSISIIGNMYSRTTLVGVFFSFVLWVILRKYGGACFKKRRKHFFTQLIVILILFSFILFIIACTSKLGSVLIKWAFEPIINLFKTGQLKTESTNELSSMFIFPNNLQTWLYGDARFINPKKPGAFYKGVDIGYLRLLYYFGIIGMFFYFVFQYQLTVYTMRFYTMRIYTKFFNVFFIMVLVLNIKGLTEISGLLFLYTMWGLSNQKKVNRESLNLESKG